MNVDLIQRCVRASVRYDETQTLVEPVTADEVQGGADEFCTIAGGRDDTAHCGAGDPSRHNTFQFDSTSNKCATNNLGDRGAALSDPTKVVGNSCAV